MSPEQASGDLARVDFRTDVYALGAILEEFLRNEKAPRRLRAVAATALAIDPDDRYQTVEEFIADLHRYLDDQTPLVYRETWFERALRFCARNRTLLFLFGAYLLTRLLIGWLSS
jgi:serine/threonine protein kinase